MKEVILHIGSRKTGTTSIQAALNGFDDGSTRYAALAYRNHSPVIYTLFSRNWETYHYWQNRGLASARIEDLRQQFRDDLEREVTNPERDRLILSGEDIALLEPDEKQDLVTFFTDRGLGVRVVCYVRDPVSFAVSAFRQQVRTGAARLWSISPDYRQHLEAFLAILPPGHLVARTYSKDRLHQGDVVADFCKLIGIAPDALPPERANPALANETLKLIWLFNRSPVRSKGTPFLFQARHRLVQELDRAFPHSSNLSPEFFIPYHDCTPGDLAFLANNFGIEFTLPDPTGIRDLGAYLDDLSDVDEDRFGEVLSRNGLAPELYATHQEKLIALFYRILHPRFEADDAAALRDMALRIEAGSALDLTDAVTLMSLAERGLPATPEIGQKLSVWTAALEKESGNT